MSSAALAAVEEERFGRISRFLESAEDQKRYRDWLEYSRHIPKDDEILRLLDIFDLLTRLTRETPEKILEEREKFAALLGDNLGQLNQLQTATAAYKDEIEKRLEKLPPELRKAIDPEKVAKQLALCLKQEFAGSGIEEIRQQLAAALDQLRPVAHSFERTAADLTDRYSGLAGSTERECNRLIQATSQMRAASNDLARESRHLHLGWMFFGAVVIFLAGCLLGQRWEKQTTTTYLAGVQYELEQMQAKLKPAVALPAPPPVTRLRRK